MSVLQQRAILEDRERKNSQGGQRRSSVSCQKVISCLWCSLEPTLSSLLPRHIVCLGPGGHTGTWPDDLTAQQSQNNRVSFSLNSLTGNVPGKDASKGDTREFGGAEKRTGEPENSLVLELIWAWTSKPTTPTSCWGELREREREEPGMRQTRSGKPLKMFKYT